MAVKVGQVYRDNDPRMKGRTMRVDAVIGSVARLEVVTNPDDIQKLLDDDTPGTRSYRPKDRRGKTTMISKARLEGSDYSEVEPPPNVTGPVD